MNILSVVGLVIAALLTALTVGTGYQWSRNDKRMDQADDRISTHTTALATLTALFDRHERWHERHDEEGD